MFIGRPSGTCTVSVTSVKIRLHDSLFIDGNKDGPFQVETPAMSTDVSVLPQRFYFGDTSVPASQRKPR